MDRYKAFSIVHTTVVQTAICLPLLREVQSATLGEDSEIVQKMATGELP